MKQRVQVSKNFHLDEFIPKEFWYDQPNWKLFRCIDPRLFPLHQKVRERHGAMTMNNYIHGGNRNESGLRIVRHTYYGIFSDHSYGRAGDSVLDKDIREVWEDIRKNYTRIYQPLGLTAIEVGKTITWLHMGIGNMLSNDLFEIKVGEQW